jgi:transposase
VVYARCAGLDVHQKTVSACVLACEPDGKKRRQVRVFGSFTGDLLVLADWLRERGVTHVAMEATGVYWRPVWAVLEGQFLTQQVLFALNEHLPAYSILFDFLFRRGL